MPHDIAGAAPGSPPGPAVDTNVLVAARFNRASASWAP
jgi:hypothetical protein